MLLLVALRCWWGLGGVGGAFAKVRWFGGDDG